MSLDLCLSVTPFLTIVSVVCICVKDVKVCGRLGLLASVCTADFGWPLDCAGSNCLPLCALSSRWPLQKQETASETNVRHESSEDYHFLKVFMLVSARFCKMICLWIKPHSMPLCSRKIYEARLALLVLGSLRTDLTFYRSYRALTRNDTSKISLPEVVKIW